MPTALTTAPASNSPEPMSMARWNAVVDASRTTAVSFRSLGVFKGLTVLRKDSDETSTPGRCGAR